MYKINWKVWIPNTIQATLEVPFRACKRDVWRGLRRSRWIGSITAFILTWFIIFPLLTALTPVWLTIYVITDIRELKAIEKAKELTEEQQKIASNNVRWGTLIVNV